MTLSYTICMIPRRPARRVLPCLLAIATLSVAVHLVTPAQDDNPGLHGAPSTVAAAAPRQIALHGGPCRLRRSGEAVVASTTPPVVIAWHAVPAGAMRSVLD